MLIPMFFLIGVWGHGRRIYAAVKFFLFTLAGSLLMLVAILALYLLHGGQTGDYTFALAALQADQPLPRSPGGSSPPSSPPSRSRCRWCRSTPGSPTPTPRRPPPVRSILAGLLLKTGVYGLLRFAFPLFPGPTTATLPVLGALALIGIFYAAWIATARTTPSGWSPTPRSPISASSSSASPPGTPPPFPAASCRWSTTASPPARCSPWSG